MKTRPVLGLLLLLLPLAGCGPYFTRDSLLFDAQELNDAQGHIRLLGQEADVVFAGTVVAIGPPPAILSGRVPSRQAIEYRVDRVYKGALGSPTITVEHIVVAGSRLADPSAIGLSPALFAPGKRLIVFATRPPLLELDLLRSDDESFGGILHSARNDLAINLML